MKYNSMLDEHNNYHGAFWLPRNQMDFFLTKCRQKFEWSWPYRYVLEDFVSNNAYAPRIKSRWDTVRHKRYKLEPFQLLHGQKYFEVTHGIGRRTYYRILKELVSKNLVIKEVTKSGILRYFLQPDTCFDLYNSWVKEETENAYWEDENKRFDINTMDKVYTARNIKAIKIKKGILDANGRRIETPQEQKLATIIPYVIPNKEAEIL